jgi:hypothetical protein
LKKNTGKEEMRAEICSLRCGLQIYSWNAFRKTELT